MTSSVWSWLSSVDPALAVVGAVGVFVVLSLGVGYAREVLAARAWLGPRR